MDIVKFWKDQTEIWNEDEKCGFCWEFAAPLVVPQMNIQQSTDSKKCCVKVFLTDISFNKIQNYNQRTGLKLTSSCEYYFNVWALIPSELGINNYNEIINHPTEGSNWEKTYKPLMDCLGCELILDYCEILGYDIELKKWQATLVHNYLDSNYNGWKIQVSFKTS